MNVSKVGLGLVFCVMAAMAVAEIAPLSPVGGAQVQLVPDAQKKVMNLATLDERLKLFEEDRKNGKKLRHDPFWRKALPVVLKLKTTKGENGPWKVLIGKKDDLSDARAWYLKTTETDKASGREKAGSASVGEVKIEVPLANLEIGTHYYWKVVCRGRCGFGCGPRHGCKECKTIVETPISDFVTEDFAPRWIAIEGPVANIRDFGGRMTSSGRRVKQGMAYRGQGLNYNSVTGEVQGRNRLTVEDVKYLTGTLGIKTDLDLRGLGETADLKESPLGPSVKFVLRSTSAYRGIFEEHGKKVMAENFRTFCDEKNYPIYFHCIGGADRTGSLAYIMNCVLGVSRHEAETDWESTFYPRIPDANPDPNFWCRESHFNKGLSKYGRPEDSWQRRAELYLLDCGVTEDEIARFRKIMLER